MDQLGILPQMLWEFWGKSKIEYSEEKETETGSVSEQ